MASFGHVAVGLMAGRLHGGGPRSTRPSAAGPCSWRVMLLFAALSVLPDADVLLVALGAPDHGAIGHRGASHSFGMALIAAALCAIAARRLRWPVVRTALAGALAVGSHALLDLLGESGSGLALFWPLTTLRFHSPIRIFPDAPRGFEILSRPGLAEICVEFLLFLPVTAYALWPRIAPPLMRALALLRLLPLRPRLAPELKVIDGGAVISDAGAAISGETPARSSDERHEPPLRSSG